MVAVIVEIHQDRARGVVKKVEAELGCRLADATVSLAQPQQVGQTLGLAEIDVFQSVSVDIPDCESVLKAMFEPWQTSDPVVRVMDQAILEGW